MEVIRLIGSVAKLVEGVRSMVKEDKDVQRNLKAALGNIKDELALLSCEVAKAWESTKTNQDAEEGMAEPEEWVLQLQDLAYEIEDFIDQRAKDSETSAPVRIVEVAMLTDPRQEHVEKIEGFRKRISSILEHKKQCAAARPTGQQVTPAPLEDDPVAEDHPVANPLGMEQAKDDLRRLLMATGGHQIHLKVISILGCSGMGKTTLVRELYEDPAVVEQFSTYLAKVEAPSSSDRIPVSTALQGIMQQVGHPNAANPAGDYEQRKTNLKGFLTENRYLVIIDGVMEYKVFEKIREALPENTLGSRVVITTRNRSVAMGCSSGSYIYTMNGLGGTYPEDLFWATFNQHRPGDGPDASRSHWLKPLLAKSDGLPHVSVAAAEFLRHHGRMLDVQHCNDVANALGYHIASGGCGFGKMRRSLQQSCQNLSRHAQEMCMMSVSSFPKGHVIKKKSLIRRWIAEGLVANVAQLREDVVARDCLCTLLDLGIIEPVPRDDITTNINVKRCQIHGVMLEFLVHRSLSWNFITLIKDGELVPSRPTACAARRLSVHGVGEVDITAQGIDLSRIRSLTVCKCNDTNGDDGNSNLTSWQGCKLLRVLDLEGCAWLTDGDLAAICELLHLKYLSLRNNKQIRVLPSAVGNLQCLETLDLRRTGVEGPLPLNVLKLPQLAHLFGKFELPEELGDAQREDELKEVLKGSQLQTLAGFKIVNNPGFTQILRHAEKLKKLKVWCEVPSPAAAAAPPLPPPSRRAPLPPPAAAAAPPPPPPTRPPPPPPAAPPSLPPPPSRSPPPPPAAAAPPPPPRPSPHPPSPAAAAPPAPRSLFNKLTRKISNTMKKKKKNPNDVAVTLPNSGQVSLPESLVESFLQNRFTGSKLDSLSIDLGGHCRQFLGSVLTDKCTVSSIKIKGEMDMFPHSTVTLKSLRNIYELHLCNTGLLSQNLSVLQNLQCLNSLKLEENNEGRWQAGDFVVTGGGFPTLKRLCFHGPRLPNVNFKPGSMQSLLSLQLICLQPAELLGVTGIRDLEKLDEVILHPDASRVKFEAWKLEADYSRNRPHVKKLLKGDDAQ